MSSEGETDPRPSRRGGGGAPHQIAPRTAPRGRRAWRGERPGPSGISAVGPSAPSGRCRCRGSHQVACPVRCPQLPLLCHALSCKSKCHVCGGSPESRVRWTAGVSAPCVTPAPGGAHDARPCAQQPARDTQGLHGDPSHRATMPRHGEGRRGLGQRWQSRVEPATRPRGGRRVQTRVPSPGKGGRP